MLSHSPWLTVRWLRKPGAGGDDPDDLARTQGTLQKLRFICYVGDEASELERGKENTQPDRKRTFTESERAKARGEWRAGWCCGSWWCSDWSGVTCCFFFCCCVAMCPSQPPASSWHHPHADTLTTDGRIEKKEKHVTSDPVSIGRLQEASAFVFGISSRLRIWWKMKQAHASFSKQLTSCEAWCLSNMSVHTQTLQSCDLCS